MKRLPKPCGTLADLRFVFFLVVATAALGSNAAPQKKGEECPSYDDVKPCLCRNFEAMEFSCHQLTSKRFLEVMDFVQKKKLPVKIMTIVDSDIPEIPDGSFEGFQIEHLKIKNSKIDSIGEKAFAPLASSLRELNLDDNQFKSVPTDSLSYLESLEILYLRTNKIQKLPSYAFTKLHNLKELYLADNNIGSVESLAFGDCCRDLTKLDLSRNLITFVPTESFFTLSNLAVLRMDGNKIEHISKEAFSGLTQLDTLDLAYNQISSIEDYAFRKSSVKNLVLSDNNLETLHKFSFAGLEDAAQWIELGTNKFTVIPTQSLVNCSRLRHLDLSHNGLTELTDDSFSKFGRHLRYIELNNNKIQHISPKALLELESVEFLMLAHNSLTKVPGATVASIIDTVFLLDLSDNPLECGCDLQWLKEWLDSVNPLDRMTPDPACYIKGTWHLKYIRQLTCNNEEGHLVLSKEPEDSPPCFGLRCLEPYVTIEYNGQPLLF